MAQSEKIIQKILVQLKEQVINFLDDLLAICPNESDIIIIRLFFENHIDLKSIMENFIKYVYPWKEFIIERNEEFFEKNEHIFGPLPGDKVKHFKRKIKDGTFTEEDKEIIWRYFEVFIALMEQYNKLK